MIIEEINIMKLMNSMEIQSNIKINLMFMEFTSRISHSNMIVRFK